MHIHVFEVFGHVKKDNFSKIENTSQICVFLYLRYSEHRQRLKYIFDQNREYLSNTRIHVFGVFRAWTTKINIFLIKIKNTFQIFFLQNREYLPIFVFMYLQYLAFQDVNKDYFSKIKNTFQICVFMYLRY